MTGELPATAIDALLRSETVAHLACVMQDGRPYVLPITYAYDGAAFYSYTADGAKLAALRANPVACIEVDHVSDAANWASAIAWGTFQELIDEDATDALRLISSRLRTVALADGAPHDAEQSYVARAGRDGVVYRIAIVELTGRYSSSGA